MIRCTPLIKLKCYTGGLASTEAALIKVGAYMLRVQRSVDFEDSNYNKWLALILKIALKFRQKLHRFVALPVFSFFAPKDPKETPFEILKRPNTASYFLWESFAAFFGVFCEGFGLKVKEWGLLSNAPFLE